jgi:predicted PurR-regulated permease PerM
MIQFAATTYLRPPPAGAGGPVPDPVPTVAGDPVADPAPAAGEASPSEAPAGNAAQRLRTTQTAALTVIAVLLALFAVHIGAGFFIPLLLSVFLSYALAPIVSAMHAIGVPRLLGATCAVALVACAIAAAAYRVGADASDVLEQIPAAAQRLRLSLVDAQRSGNGSAALENVQRAATEIEKLANAAAPANPAAKAHDAAPAPAPDHLVDVRSMLFLGTSNAFIAAGQLLFALALTLLLLAAGDRFRRKLIGAVGPSIANRRTALRILEDIDKLNRRYFAVVLAINVAIGVATALAFHAIGLERPAVWGIAAAVLHSIPYVGTALIAGAAALVAYGQFGTMEAVLLAGTVPLVIAAFLGIAVQTWLMGRATRMSASAVFVSLLFWGMIWGGWGLLLGVPMMVAAKTACDHIKPLRAVGAMLGP